MESEASNKLLKINTLRGYYKGSWEEIRPSLPLPSRRCYHSSSIYKESLVIFGGQDLIEGVRGDLWMFEICPSNPTQERWHLINGSGEPPGHLCRHSSIMFNDEMYIFGGNDGSNENNSVYVFNFDRISWRRIRGDVPSIDSHTAIVYNSKMIIFGGYMVGDLINETYVFDIPTSRWKMINIADKPEERADHRGVLYNNCMWVYGGKGTDGPLDDLWKLDLERWIWARIQYNGDSPGTVSGHTACIYGEVMLVFGGAHDILKETNEMYTYDFENNNWVLIQTETLIEDPVSPGDVENFMARIKRRSHSEPKRVTLYNGPPCQLQGRVKDKVPYSRDGHSANLFGKSMIIFGGDRHQMSFNDLYSYSVHQKIRRVK